MKDSPQFHTNNTSPSTITLTDSETGRRYPIFVKLPPSYSPTGFQSYPVVYVTDAVPNFDMVSAMLHTPMRSGAMENVIIVGIGEAPGEGKGGGRVRDFTPVKSPNWKAETGQAPAFVRFLTSEVFPYVESHYRTADEERTYVGHSLGGLLGAYILMSQPDLFNGYVLSSPSVWYVNNAILSQTVVKPSRPTRVWISSGERETPEKSPMKNNMIDGAEALQAYLESSSAAAELELRNTVIPGATHVTAFPTAAVQGVSWIYQRER